MQYFLRKIGFYVVALWAALTLNFIIPRLLPGNPVDILLAKLQQRGGQITRSQGGVPAAPRWRLLAAAHRAVRGSTSATCSAVTSGCR